MIMVLARLVALLMVAACIAFLAMFTREPLMAAAGEIWSSVGVVTLGLAPLTIYLIAVFLLVSVRRDWREIAERFVQISLRTVVFAAPMFGVLGTVFGMADALSALVLSEGVEAIIQGLSELIAGLSVALMSTAWGLMLAIPAGVLDVILFDANPSSGNAVSRDRLNTEQALEEFCKPVPNKAPDAANKKWTPEESKRVQSESVTVKKEAEMFPPRNEGQKAYRHQRPVMAGDWKMSQKSG